MPDLDKGFQALRLSKPVTYSHPNFWGRKSHIWLEPCVPSDSTIWTWSPDGGPPVSIDTKNITTERRRIQLISRGHRLEVLEHITPLRFGGLVGVNMLGRGWPPYHGRALELWDITQTETYAIGYELPHYTVKQPVSYTYPKPLKGERIFPSTCIRPPADPADKSLTLDIHINYKGLGEYREVFKLPDLSAFREICSAHAQGWPRYTYRLARLLQKFKWPHMKSVTWPQDGSEKQVLRKFALHRAQDLLGALALLCQNGFFVGHVISHCSGHFGDVQAVRQAQACLTMMK